MFQGRQGREYIVGYQSEIRKGLWERVKTLGGPRIIASLWLVICLSVAFVFAVTMSLKLGVAAMGFWALGHGLIVALTLIDPHWDEVMLAQWVRGYKAYYEAG
jgi:type IV secretory pathway TrbD component